MAEALGKKRKVRGGYRAYVTTVIAEVLPNYQPEQQTDLRKFKITLKEQLYNLKNLDEQIIELIDEKEINEEVANAGKYRSDVHEIILKIDQVLDSNAVNNQATVASQAIGNNDNNSEKKMVARLPKLELKGFSGDPTTWMSFWDSFSSAVDQNDYLSEVDKFNHLKTLVHGAAATTIAGLSLTSTNYKVALDLLKGRFANEQVIISLHMERLLKLPSIPSGDITMLRELFDIIESQIRALQALGVESTNYGGKVFLLPKKSTLPETTNA